MILPLHTIDFMMYPLMRLDTQSAWNDFLFLPFGDGGSRTGYNNFTNADWDHRDEDLGYGKTEFGDGVGSSIEAYANGDGEGVPLQNGRTTHGDGCGDMV